MPTQQKYLTANNYYDNCPIDEQSLRDHQSLSPAVFIRRCGVSTPCITHPICCRQRTPAGRGSGGSNMTCWWYFGFSAFRFVDAIS
jgi:hypothetical protein